MNPQEQFWSGKDGDAYTNRNRVDWRARIPFWRGIMEFTGARSVYELGCNAGWNLSAIKEASPHRVSVHGREINEEAAFQARFAGIDCLLSPPGFRGQRFPVELVFTAGVLIHIAPEELHKTMQELIDDSSHWVLAIEYAADAEEMIEYRGRKDRLWKRPYGKLYKEMGLSMLDFGWATGFDRCTYWLMEKP